MNTQPEALRLAQELARELEALNLTKDETLFQEMVLAQELVRELEASAAHRGGAMDRQAAAELRYLHAEVETLREAGVGYSQQTMDAVVREREKLREVNAALLEALRTALDASYDGPMPDHARVKARAAIARAEEVQP